jgi:hypothetical protein
MHRKQQALLCHRGPLVATTVYDKPSMTNKLSSTYPTQATDSHVKPSSQDKRKEYQPQLPTAFHGVPFQVDQKLRRLRRLSRRPPRSGHCRQIDTPPEHRNLSIPPKHRNLSRPHQITGTNNYIASSTDLASCDSERAPSGFAATPERQNLLRRLIRGGGRPAAHALAPARG